MPDKNQKPKDLLDWLGLRAAPDFAKARWIGAGVSFILILMFMLALGAAVLVMVHTIGQALNPDAEGPNLGAGALIAALLGAPFLIWTTVLKHQTVRYQKEGHMTDRINTAVEQLGAEKTVERIGRPVTVWTGTPERVNYATEDAVKFIGQTRTHVSSKEWQHTWNHETDENEEGYRSTVSIWPSERTIIQWQGETIAVSADEAIGIESPWQVFKETQPNLEVRIGAILSLERIAQDSTTHDKGRDHVRVMEILCAYVRQNAPASKAISGPTTNLKGQNQLDEKAELRRETSTWAHSLPTPRMDIEIVLKVIGRRSLDQREIEKNHFSFGKNGYHPDLSNTNMQHANLEDMDFNGTNFFKSRLECAFGNRTDFSKCNFIYADLTSISASGANFSDSMLDQADLSFSILDKAKFNLSRVSHTHFVKSQLNGTNFRFLNPQIGNLPVNSAFFIECTMQESIFEGWLASGIIITQRQNEHAEILMQRRLKEVALRDAVVAHHSWGRWHTFLSSEILPQLFGDSSVALGNMERPSHWPTWTLPLSGKHNFHSEWAKWRTDPANYTPPPPP